MSELIDRQALIKQLKDENIPFNADINEIINIQPIAFDVANILENIVTSLENEKTVFLGTRIEQTDTILIDDAINIVKQEISNGLE